MAARADQARHQSSHEPIAAVTSSKSVSTTPLVTKRGPQCPIAEVMRGSVDMDDSSFVEQAIRGAKHRELIETKIEALDPRRNAAIAASESAPCAPRSTTFPACRARAWARR